MKKLLLFLQVLILSATSLLGGGSGATRSDDVEGRRLRSGGGDDQDGITAIIDEDLFNKMLAHRGDERCEGDFYTYDAFVEAASKFAHFGTTGDQETRKRELAAFFAQTSHETTGGWNTAPDGPFAWGYCWVRERGTHSNYCVRSWEWPCAPGKKYYGRGPIQLTYNYNYGKAGEALGVDLLSNPDLVATDPELSFGAAMWYWMTPQSPSMPSCHEVMTGQWRPSWADRAAGRLPGYGVVTNIIDGGAECGRGPVRQGRDRIGYYLRYCKLLGVEPDENLDCYHQMPFSPFGSAVGGGELLNEK